MRHYELVVMIHPDHKTDDVTAMSNRYKEIIESASGKIHRFEDWGRITLEYQIEGAKKAHFLLMNIEADQATIDNLINNVFKFSDSVIRHLLIRKEKAVTDKSPMLNATRKEQGSKRFARITPEDLKHLDYSNLHVLKMFLTEAWRVSPRRNTGLSAYQQRQLAHAVKLARFLGLLAYCDHHQYGRV
jgi:small subunit ribosomal protein S6